MEIIYLQAFDKAVKAIKLDTLEVISKEGEVRTAGWYQYLQDKLTALYFQEDDFFFRYDNLCVKVEEGITAKSEKENGQYQFSLYRKDQLILGFKYSVSDYFFESEVDLTPFVEAEDFNWGLFLCNIINSRSRMDNIKAYYKE
jgi:hypothetical protein